MAEYVEPYSTFHLSFVDVSNEISGINLYMDEITALNFVAINAEKVALTAAIRNLSLCNPLNSQLAVAGTQYNMGVPASPWAQREIALQVGYHDTVNGKRQLVSIPGVDWATLKGDGDHVNYNHASWAAFRVAFELTARSMYGNPVVVDFGRFIGRRS